MSGMMVFASSMLKMSASIVLVSLPKTVKREA
jgi:hypothetical protein